MSRHGAVFDRSDLVPLWDRGPGFLPLRPPAGVHHWRYDDVRTRLAEVSVSLDQGQAERRVALLAHPGLGGAQGADGLHVGLQLLEPGESAPVHRHTPAALRIGLEGDDVVTIVDDETLPLGPLDVVLNPSGTWHGHRDRAGTGAVWLDVVDLPLVSALGAVLFEPARPAQPSSMLDPDRVPDTVVFPWGEVAAALDRAPEVDGVRQHRYGDGQVLPTLAVTALRVEDGATLTLPRRTCGSVVLLAAGRADCPSAVTGRLGRHDVVGLRSWTPLRLTACGSTIVLVVDTSPAVRALGLYREEPVG